MTKYRVSYPRNTVEFTRLESAQALVAELAALPEPITATIETITYEPYVEGAPVPAEVTPLQMRRALNAAGLRSAVEAAVAGADQDARDAWEFATVVLRSDPLLNGMASEMGLRSEQVDGLFVAAASYT